MPEVDDDTKSSAPLSKAERTQRRIFDGAMALFEREGFDKTTLRKIASEAKCSLGLTYRYFSSKDDLVVALYRRIAHEHDAQVRELFGSKDAPSTLGGRFVVAMEQKLDLCAPYRHTFAAVQGAALNPDAAVAALGPAAADVRALTLESLQIVVDGAQDLEDGPVKDSLPLLLFVGQLLALLFWVHDDTADSSSTKRLLHQVGGLFDLVMPFADHPMIIEGLQELTQTLSPIFDKPIENEGEKTGDDDTQAGDGVNSESDDVKLNGDDVKS